MWSVLQNLSGREDPKKKILRHTESVIETDAKKIRLAQNLAVSKKSTILIQSS